ncbi:MAG: SDR family NAD(P)-dependent oxidoreductase [Rhodospirillales bacterium]|jgi:NADP-dependent 3-hydroxy acid dehydrogenase YdfG|nr:SDR family NAD(P)-dependent oxidoreductase [Rhodospirillales bacterium]MDP6774211.1 SDR family NAD(P)-dependent oxidoreductase [Rhodospirillales bacterium]
MNDYRIALVTGATSGIGRAVAVALAGRGLEVHAVARRGDMLAELEKEAGCRPHAVDVSDTKALEAMCDGLEVDVLINAAGMAVGYLKAHEQGDIDDFDVMVDVNVTAYLRLLRLVVPGMVERDRGHIVNLGSMWGLYPVGGATTYATVKGAIHQLSQCLRVDLLGQRVRVTEICPGRVETGFHATALGDAEAARKTFYEGNESLSPEDVTEAILFALETPPHVNISMIEMAPQMQAPSGVTFAKPLR